MDQCALYLVRDHYSGAVKIGISKHPQKRLCRLRALRRRQGQHHQDHLVHHAGCRSQLGVELPQALSDSPFTGTRRTRMV